MMNLQKIMTTLGFMLGFVVQVFGMSALPKDSLENLNLPQLYAVQNGTEGDEIHFKTEEKSVQYHDGQAVFSTRRTTEYQIRTTANKIVIKRHVISSDGSVLCADPKVQKLYPDMTAQLLSGVLTPRKIKTDHPGHIAVKREGAEPSPGCRLVVDKLAQHPVEKEGFMGVTVEYETATEDLVYTSNLVSLDALQTIQSEVALNLTEKSGQKHQIQVSETIRLIF